MGYISAGNVYVCLLFLRFHENFSYLVIGGGVYIFTKQYGYFEEKIS